MNNPEQILKDLQRHSYAEITTAKPWDSNFRYKLRQWLKEQGYPQCQFYRVANQENTYIIALPHACLPSDLEKEYKQGIILSLLPLFCLFIIVYLTVFLAKDMDKMSVPVIIMGIPFVIGMLIEYFSSLEKPSSMPGMLFNSMIMTGLIVVSSLFAFGEGIFCVILALPLIFFIPLVGMLIMRLICYFFWRPSPKIYSLAFLPLVLMVSLPDTSSDHYGQTQRSVIIHAPIEKVFHEIQYIGKIKPEEVRDNFIFVMGVPKPIFGTTEQHNGRTLRHMQWQGGVDFKEEVVNAQPPYALDWIYRFQPDSFPKDVLDEHVQIGGKHFNLLKAGYQLQKIDNQTTKLTLMVDYRLTTEYNWYSKLWANYLLNQFSDVVMAIPKQRLEQKS